MSDGAERLAAVAALLMHDPEASRRADAWMRANGTPCSPAETDLIESATDAEWDLSAALRADSGPASAMMAALLQLADGTDVAVPLRLGLRERFLPADGGPGVPESERTADLADRYRKLAMPGLDARARQQAEVVLARIV